MPESCCFVDIKHLVRSQHRRWPHRCLHNFGHPKRLINVNRIIEAIVPEVKKSEKPTKKSENPTKKSEKPSKKQTTNKKVEITTIDSSSESDDDLNFLDGLYD